MNALSIVYNISKEHLYVMLYGTRKGHLKFRILFKLSDKRIRKVRIKSWSLNFSDNAIGLNVWAMQINNNIIFFSAATYSSMPSYGP